MPNDNNARLWYASHVWPSIQSTTNVLDDARDLGAHISATRVKHSATLTERCKAAAKSADAIDKLPMDRTNKAKAIRTHVLPKALDGCEVASVNQNTMDTLTMAILRAINPDRGQRSRDLTSTVCSEGNDVDPEINILERSYGISKSHCQGPPH